MPSYDEMSVKLGSFRPPIWTGGNLHVEHRGPTLIYLTHEWMAGCRRVETVEFPDELTKYKHLATFFEAAYMKQKSQVGFRHALRSMFEAFF